MKNDEIFSIKNKKKKNFFLLQKLCRIQMFEVLLHELKHFVVLRISMLQTSPFLIVHMQIDIDFFYLLKRKIKTKKMKMKILL